MEGRTYTPPSAVKWRQNLKPQTNSTTPVHDAIGDRSTAVQHQEMQALLIENQRLVTLREFLNVELSAAQNELHHLSFIADKVKAERDSEVRELYDRAVNMETQIRSIDESSAELAQALGDLQKLRRENKELDEKLNELHSDVEKVSVEYPKIPLKKAEIKTMQKEIQRGRKVIEHEKGVYASNIEQRQAMENCRMLMAREIVYEF